MPSIDRSFWLSCSSALLLASLLASCSGAKKSAISTSEYADAALINAKLGTEYLRKNMLSQARFKLERALEQDDGVALAHSSYAILMVRVGDKDLARKHFKRALQLAENDSDTHNNFGLFLCDEGRYEQALTYFSKAYSDPFYDRPEIALANAGVCLARDNRIEDGIKYVQRAISLKRDYADGYRQLAYLYHEAGKLNQAKAKIEDYYNRFGYTLSSLQLGVQIARSLGDKTQMAEYLGIMGRKFPDSSEYQDILEDLRKNPIK